MYLTQALHRNAQQQPDAPCTIFGEREYSHSQALDRISRAAGGLKGLGVTANDMVAILSLNSDSRS